MDEENVKEKTTSHDRLKNILNNFTKLKSNLINDTKECKNLKEINRKLTTELQEVKELEKSHRYHLTTSREMIANLQETVSQLVYLKRDVKKLKDQIVSKDSVITAMEKENENTARKHKDSLTDLQLAHETQINAMISDCDKKVQQIQIEAETQIAQITFVAEEERTKTKEMESNHKDKMNEVVLQYEERIQRQAASVSQLQEELARQAARSDANIEAYRRKLENLEEKLKQSQFKEYLAHSTRSTQLYESRGERPYSVERDSREIYSHHSDTMHDSPKRRLAAQRQGQSQKQGTLQVMYHDGKPKSAEKKGQFNISKKRKLYNANEFLNRSEF